MRSGWRSGSTLCYLNDVKILVTGGAGFIGSHIVEALLAQGHEVAVLDNLSSGKRENVPAKVRLYEVDLRDRDATFKAMADFRPNAVSHQAAQASVSVSMREPKLDAEVNVIGGINLLDACTASGAAVERFVFASTGGAIYGEVAPGTRASEGTQPRPASPYAIHKLTLEHLLSVYHARDALNVTTLRYANVYGPRQDPHGEAGVVAIFFNAILEGRKIRVNARAEAGDSGCLRDYIFVSDVARLNVLGITGGLRDSVVNAGTGKETDTRTLAEMIMRVTGRNVDVEYGAVRAGDLQRSVLDPRLTEQYLGSLVGLDQGMRSTFEFYSRKHGTGG